VKPKRIFKSPPKRFQPKGLDVLYEDHDLLVVEKRNGILLVSSARDREKTAYYLLGDYVRKGNPKSKNRILIVHRMDRESSGILVFAKNEQAKRILQGQWQSYKKTCTVVVRGRLPEKKGIITSHLAENSIHKMYSVNDPAKGKFAQTAYTVVKESENYSFLEVELLTDRKNQVRVQFADKGCPVAGDKKYGVKDSSIKRLTLHMNSLTMIHPVTKQAMTFDTKVPGYFYSLLSSRG